MGTLIRTHPSLRNAQRRGHSDGIAIMYMPYASGSESNGVVQSLPSVHLHARDMSSGCKTRAASAATVPHDSLRGFFAAAAQTRPSAEQRVCVSFRNGSKLGVKNRNSVSNRFLCAVLSTLPLLEALSKKCVTRIIIEPNSGNRYEGVALSSSTPDFKSSTTDCE